MKRSLPLPLTLASLAVATAQQNLRGLQTGGTSWYVYYQDSTDSQYNKCVNTCTDPSVEYCKGGQGSYATVEECCTKGLYWECTDGPPPCYACTDAPYTPVPVDTTKWYVRDSDSKCVRNCDTADGTDCGGVQWNSWIRKFASMEECCDQAIPWKCFGVGPPAVCEACTIGDASAYTPAAPTPTNEFYVNWETNKCVENCEKGSGNAACGGIVVNEPWKTLYPDVQQCCQQHLSSLCASNPDNVCSECTDADVSAWAVPAPAPGAAKWYAKEGKCVQDCAVGGDPGCGGTLPADNSWTRKHDDVQQCCEVHLSWKCPNNPEYGVCPECTNDGVDVSAWYTPPDPSKFYEKAGKCVQNCEGASPCGGVNEDSWVKKYDDVQLCCKEKLFWKCPGVESGVCSACTDADISTWIISAP